MKFRWKCDKCGLDEQSEVRDRQDDEDIKAYMDVVLLVVGFDHVSLRPGCLNPTVTLLLPVPHGSDRIGTPGVGPHQPLPASISDVVNKKT